MTHKSGISMALVLSLAVFAVISNAQNRPTKTAGKDGVGVPSCVRCAKPQYSQAALKAKFSGTVTLSGVIGLDGRATKLKVVDSPPYGLGQKAIEAVRLWRFVPAPGLDGKPVAVTTTIHVHFGLSPEQQQ